jgi:hypothetical protein
LFTTQPKRMAAKGGVLISVRALISRQQRPDPPGLPTTGARYGP